MEELFLNLKDKLPFKLNFVEYKNYYRLKDDNSRYYYLFPFDEKSYTIVFSLYKSNKIEKPIFELKYQNTYYLLFYEAINSSEYKERYKKIMDLCLNIFSEFRFPVTLKHSHTRLLTNLYKLLDNKFTYFEMRIREIELKPLKNDLDWIILTKYHIILDAKVYLYDLQSDLFKLIDKKTEVEYGLVYKELDSSILYVDTLYPSSNIYYAPIGMLYTRLYLEYNDLFDTSLFKDKIDKSSEFNKKYFLFMTIYIYILNLRLEIIINNSSISNYLEVTSGINRLITNFKDYAK
ncbi:MAG: hypothetical protein ACI35S_01345 [Anaeroplasma sp.]